MKEPLRVAHIIGKWVGGGVESVVMNYYRYIDKAKIQFDFFIDEDSTMEPPVEEIENLGGKVYKIPSYTRIIKYHKELKKLLKENNYKIVHSHVNTLSVFPLFAAKCAKVPVRIAHSHSTTNKKEWKKNIIKQILRPFSKVFATDYMCCSELAGRWLFGNKAYDQGKVYLLNNAIDLDKFKYDEKTRIRKRKELGIKEDTLVIGHIGRFVEQKNHTFLIDIFNEVHNEQSNSILLLIGEGPLKEEIQEKVNNLQLTDSVKFLGQRTDVNELYQAMDVFVLPSLYEGLPVVGIEAQASGLPCIFSDSITNEVKITNSTKFLTLNESSIWSKILLNIHRNFNFSLEMKQTYDIFKESLKLCDFYNKFNNKMKIIHLVNSKNFSGLENVACDIITNLSKNFDMIYVTQEGPIVDILKEKKVNYYIIKKMSIKEIRNLVKEINPNVIHAHDFTASVISSFSNLKIPIISHIHNNPPWIKTLHPFSILYFVASINFKKILIVSNSIQNEYIFSRFIKRKIQCIGNPLSRAKVLTSITGTKNLKKYDICCVARLTLQKNPYKFLKIIKKVKDTYDKNIKVIWIGNGELYNDIKNKIELYNLENNIKLLGFKKDPYKYMYDSKIFLLTSDWEGYGLVAFEAITLGLPCVVSDVGGLNNIVDSTCGFLCQNENDYYDEIIKLLKNNNYYNKKSINAIKKSIKLENYDKYLLLIKDIYYDVLR